MSRVEHQKIFDSSAPSVRQLQKKLALDPFTARRAHALMTGRMDPRELPSIRTWMNTLYRRPDDCEAIMRALDSVLGGYGVEVLGWKERGPQIAYVDMGDPRALTIVYDRDWDTFKVRAWGDEVERWESRYGEDDED